MIRLAINGYGRIGRSVLRALYESGRRRTMQVVAINEPADLATVAHLTRYDTTHGRFPGSVEVSGDDLVVNGDRIQVTHATELEQLQWADIDVVLECSGRYGTPAELAVHLQAGARRVLLSQPGASDLPVVVYGINHQSVQPWQTILSTGSCTTNCVVPVIKTLDDAFGISEGVTTTIHSSMNDQPVLDAYHNTDLRKTRAAGQSIIPVETELGSGIGRLLPALAGRFVSHALRVPTLNVSAIQLSVNMRQPISTERVNSVLREAAAGGLADVLGYTEEPLASCDFNHDSRSGIVDASQTRVVGPLANVLIWFDNEWAYANRMLDVVACWTA
ncbi:MAG: glyceraldehyde 3-phosphate dehydrogenase NAD-binding domain-containing protein [Spongiibacteraceae bacterium]|jgi:glyceraldehyde-3-phosphate dehydrogenase type I|nr:glyceraldehyde 3-phosphate dehydrogenase NAD-binding domain-containing protein [Spongiibacteraceae bacterium]